MMDVAMAKYPYPGYFELLMVQKPRNEEEKKSIVHMCKACAACDHNRAKRKELSMTGVLRNGLTNQCVTVDKVNNRVRLQECSEQVGLMDLFVECSVM
jgi:hypothetical protein